MARERLFNVYRNGVFLGSLRAWSVNAACRAYAEWAKCDQAELTAQEA